MKRTMPNIANYEVNKQRSERLLWPLASLLFRRRCPVCEVKDKVILEMAAEDLYTKDGTVDRHNKPANKEETGNKRTIPFILGNECCERLAYYGMGTNLVVYMKLRLNQPNATAANNVTNWSGTCYITPLIGAFLADAYWGRYRTIFIFSIIYVIGMTLLTLSASVPGIKPSCHGDDCHPKEIQSAVFFIALYLIALGTGGIKPCVSSFGADQFDDNDEKEKKTKSSYFNWFYFSINIGALIASSVLVWIQMNVGWGWGFGIPAVAMAIALMFFLSGTPMYRRQKPGGSPLTRLAQVIVAAIRKYNVKVPSEKALLYENVDDESAIEGSRKLDHTDQFGFFDKAATVTEADEVKMGNAWNLCTVTQVEELKSIIRILPIWASGIVFSAVYSQMSTMFVLQGGTMDPRMGPHFEIPSASLSIFDTLSVLVWVPIYNNILVPMVGKYRGNKYGFTQLERIGIGLVISVLAMVVAGVLEVVRLGMVRRNNYYDLPQVPMSIFWQVPQYFIIGCAEVFTFIGQLEFFYDQAPDAMRSTCAALSLTTNALGNYLSTLLVTVVTNVTTRGGKLGWIPDNLNRGHLENFYWLLAVLSVVNFFVYLWIAKCSNAAEPGGPPSSEGDKRKQELLAKIAQLQAEKVRLTDYLDDRSAYLTQFAEDANAEFDEVAENARKGLEEASDRIMENLESRMQAFEEAAQSNKEEIEKNDKLLADFEEQLDKDRNEGLFFKNLKQKPPQAKQNAAEEVAKLKKVTKENFGLKVRSNIYLALIYLLIFTIADTLIFYPESDWRKVAALGVILVGLVAQFLYEQKMSASPENIEGEDEEK
ncbi:hypothetical protein H6P81_006826 [Aristolochia fimbriata]|uniref:Uncharacterized protein n=1 Tax=Aristolochia fimbriata TaxID=158543 RepID=A0AAV7EYM3_ARIFI|nr:hypothetical protein H6P81_006826 [Aristolochia fimbriata]